MKVASKVIFLFRDTKGFASAISDAFRSNPSPSFRCLEDSFELSLEGYGIKDHKASGSILHFVNPEGTYQVSLVIMQHYEPPVLACAVKELLSKIAGDKSSPVPSLYVPVIVESSQIKGESKSLSSYEGRALVYGIQIGQERETNEALISKIVKPPSSLRIQHETLACCLHLLNVLRLPTFFLIGQTGQSSRNKSTEEFEVSLVIMQHYEPPVLACAVNELLSKIAGDKSSPVPSLYVPVIVESSQIKGESKSLRSYEGRALVYGIQIGQERETDEALLSKIVKPPSSLRIQHETLACCLHLLNVLRLPTFFLIGQTGQSSRNKFTEEFEITHTIGEILASATGLNYSKESVKWNPTGTPRYSKEPWQALYG